MMSIATYKLGQCNAKLGLYILPALLLCQLVIMTHHHIAILITAMECVGQCGVLAKACEIVLLLFLLDPEGLTQSFSCMQASGDIANVAEALIESQ